MSLLLSRVVPLFSDVYEKIKSWRQFFAKESVKKSGELIFFWWEN